MTPMADVQCILAELPTGAVLVSFRHQPNASLAARVEAISRDGRGGHRP